MTISFQTEGANSADPDQTASVQGLHCLKFILHFYEIFLCGKISLFKFYSEYSNNYGVRIFRYIPVLTLS